MILDHVDANLIKNPSLLRWRNYYICSVRTLVCFTVQKRA